MATIRDIEITGSFRYLWLKAVTGVNLEEHCAKCLLGEYDPRISASMRRASGLELPEAPFHYLCGVTTPYVWARNFHLAWRHRDGSTLAVERHGIRITIDNAEEVTFGESDIDPQDRHIKYKTYRTCRNWQFAHKISPLL